MISKNVNNINLSRYFTNYIYNFAYPDVYIENKKYIYKRYCPSMNLSSKLMNKTILKKSSSLEIKTFFNQSSSPNMEYGS